MTCPDCLNVIPLSGKDRIVVTYCNRCGAKLNIQITVLKHGDPEKIKQTLEWQGEGKEYRRD